LHIQCEQAKLCSISAKSKQSPSKRLKTARERRLALAIMAIALKIEPTKSIKR